MTAQQMELVQKVRSHAIERYNESFGWSMIVECFTNEEILEELINHWSGKEITTEEEAFAHFKWIADLHTERNQEVCSEIW
jgi:hypothetical protein